MEDLGKYLSEQIEQQGRTKVWIADQAGIKYQTLSEKLRHDRITGYDLLRIAKILGIDLNELKNKLEE